MPDVLRPSVRAAAPAVAAGLLGVVLTALVVARDVALVSAEGRGQVALDTVAATIGLLLAFLVYGRFRESRLQRDALLCVALLILGCGNAVLSVLPAVLDGDSGRLTSASALAGLVAGMLFAIAAWAPPVEVDVAQRPRVTVDIGVLTLIVLGASWGLSRLVPKQAVGSADTFGTGGDVFLTSTQLTAALAFFVAAAGWSRSSAASRQADEIAGLLAVAAVFGGLSRVGFAVAPAADSAWVTAGTTLRAAFYLTLMAAGAVEISGYWRRVAQVAVLEERRRIARNLHDGMAQELAFIATQARSLAQRSEHPTRARLIAAAAERALDESRRAIAALTRPLDEPLEVSVAQCAEEVCGRFDAGLVLDVEPGLRVYADTREALLRILREAMSNGLRHGRARTVTVRLHGSAPTRLTVEDDGSGFDQGEVGVLSGRFGLVSMRERAEALGGTFRLASASPGGTTVEVELP